MKRPLLIVVAVAVVAVLVVGILQSGGGAEGPAGGASPTAAAAREALAGAPEPLAALHADANELLAVDGFQDRIRALRGYPIVVNVWGSWCNPCREEFPVFQRVAISEGRRVAFLGLATQDSEEGAGAFLRERPVSYPHYMDFDGKVAKSLGAIGAPATIFYDRRGRQAYFHQGKYDTDADLKADIRRYAGA